MKRILTATVLIVLVFSLCLIFTSCGDGETQDPTPKQLSAPFVSISDSGLASWASVDNARGYTYKINGGEEKNTTELSVQLTNGQSIEVKAVGDGTNYTDSAYSNAQTYTASTQPSSPTALATPTVTIDANGVASWSAVPNASGYKYKIDNGTEQTATALSVQLTNGQSIQVKAVGDGTNYTDSLYSAAQTYTASTQPSNPTALSVPTVTIDANGIASWSAVPNASGYKYKLDNGAELSILGLSIQLINGQSIQVKAVGDGINYTDSAYSAAKTYTAAVNPPPHSGTEPDYLGILASSSAPLQSDGVPNSILPSTALMSLSARYGSNYRYYADALDEYFENQSNHLGSSFPVESGYSLYSAPSQTVYVQIWLNNPSQHTILSLKLNGTKYQVGGGLSSFFIEKSGIRYNCVYVAVTIPANTYDSITYEVSDIEYISGSFINQDGTDEFMNNNDTVSIGLPYEATAPTVSEFNPTAPTYNSASATFILSDMALAEACGGWVGVAVYDGYNIIKNVAATVNSNSVTVTGLVENTYYYVYIYLYGDLHDGNGVSAHTLYQEGFYTQSVIDNDTYSVEGEIAYDNDLDRYLAQISLNVSLISPTAEFIKVEVYSGDYYSPTLITTLNSFNGIAKITDGILNGESYDVKIYYRDNEYPEGKCITESVYITSLGSVYKYDEEYYSIYNDLVLNFTLGNNDENYAHVDSFTMYVFSEDLPSYWAELILAYIDNPDIIDELDAQANEQWDLMYSANINGNYELGDIYYAEYQRLINEKSKYENAKYALESRFENNTDRAYWEAEAAKGKYAYTLTYDSAATSDIFKVGKVYYVVLEDFYALDDWRNYQYEIVANIDKNDGDGLLQETYYDSLYHSHIFTQFNGLLAKDIVFGSDSISYKLYNQDCYDDAGEYFTANFGYVWKIVATMGYQYSDDYKEITLYEIATAPDYGANADAWLAAYIAAVKAGEDTTGLIYQYIGEYDESYQTSVDLSALSAHGHWDIHIYTRLYLGEYTEDDLYDNVTTETYLKKTQIQAPTVKIEGQYAVVQFPDNNYYTVYYNVKNAEGQLIVDNQAGDSSYYLETVGYQIQVRLESYEDGLTPSEWSEWVTFDGIKLTVSFEDYNMESCSVSWYSSIAVAGWVYTLNGGSEISLLPENNSLVLSNGDVIRVKAIAVADTDYRDSDWAEFTCTDTRVVLATPSNVRLTNTDGTNYLEWTMSSTDGVETYIIYVDGEEYIRGGAYDAEMGVWFMSLYKLTAGATYQVQAITSDTENYRNSVLSDGATA